jgi:uncharacterized protein YceK
MKNILVLIIAVVTLSGCSASLSRMSMGNSKVEMYSGGQLVKTWTSSGRVLSEEGSDGWYFTDSTTNKVVIVSGDIVITPL